MALISPSPTVAVEEINVACYIMYMVDMSRTSIHYFILLFKTCCLCLRTVVLFNSDNLTVYNPLSVLILRTIVMLLSLLFIIVG